MSRPCAVQGSQAEFERLGYTIYRDVIDRELIAEASTHVDWLTRRHPDLRPENLGTKLVGNDPFWLRLVSDPRLLDIAEEYVGPDIALFASHYISKPAGDGRPVLWHQDGSYWPLEPMAVISLWLAIDDSTPENGCVRVIPGTQHDYFHNLERREDVANVLNSGIDPTTVNEGASVDLVLTAGDVSIHHPNVIHGSDANTSPKRRCGLTIRYIPASTRIVSDRPWPSAFLLRGEAVAGANDYQRLPQWRGDEHMPFRGCAGWGQI